MTTIKDEKMLYAYMISLDNVICELPVENYCVTSGTSGVQVIGQYAKAFGFDILTIEREEWEPEDWDRGYAALEEMGRFTPERRTELFDI